jgi:hypothetical protein
MVKYRLLRRFVKKNLARQMFKLFCPLRHSTVENLLAESFPTFSLFYWFIRVPDANRRGAMSGRSGGNRTHITSALSKRCCTSL